jgi:hypothetical protein
MSLYVPPDQGHTVREVTYYSREVASTMTDLPQAIHMALTTRLIPV